MVSLKGENLEATWLRYLTCSLPTMQWSLGNASNLLKLLKCFEVASGLRINLNKGHVFWSWCSKFRGESLASEIALLELCLLYSIWVCQQTKHAKA